MIYFDNSATTRYKPKQMIKSMVDILQNSANGGRASHLDAMNTAIQISSARTFFAEKLNANEIIWTKNCTEALNIVIFGLLKQGDHCISAVTEHNAVLRPLFELKNRGVITLTILNPDNKTFTINPTHVERAINKNTALVVINAINNVTGTINDYVSIGAVLKKYKIPYLVDGAQSIPHINFNMKEQNISYLACAGHKGLHGPQGTGFLALNKISDINPLIYGGTGTNSDSVYQPHALPEGLEAGTLNSAGIVGLYNSAKWTYSHSDRINNKIRDISRYILQSLYEMPEVKTYTPYNSENGVISFNILDMDSSQVGDILNGYDIAVRTGLHCAPLMHNYLGTLESGAVRVSVGYNNSLDDAKKLIYSIKKIIIDYK